MGQFPIRKGKNWDYSPLPFPPAGGDNAAMRKEKLPPDAGTLAREIHRLMAEKGIGQKALAIAAGVGETYVHDILRGKSRNPRLDQLGKIAQALGRTVEQLRDPGRSSETKQDSQAIQSEQEAALIRLWRMASPEGRDRIVSSIERELFGILRGTGEVKDV